MTFDDYIITNFYLIFRGSIRELRGRGTQFCYQIFFFALRIENLDIIGMWETIKNILKKNKGTCIIIEDGRPAYVIMLFDDYQKSLANEPVNKSVSPLFKEAAGETELMEKINQEIVDWKVKQAANSSEVQLADIQDSDELRIENLPLV